MRSGNIRNPKDVEDGELADSPKVAQSDTQQQQDDLKQRTLASVDSRKRDNGSTPTHTPLDPSTVRPIANNTDVAESKSGPAQDRPSTRGGRSTPLERSSHALPDRPEFASTRGRQSVSGQHRPSGPADDRPDPRGRYATGSGRLDRPRDLVAEEEHRGISPGRLGGPTERGGAPSEHYREREAARPFDRSGRTYPDDGGRPPIRDLRPTSREPLPEYPFPPERSARYDDRTSRPDMRVRSDYTRESRDSRDVAPPHQNDLASVNPARAAQIAGDPVVADSYGRRAPEGYTAPRSHPPSPGRSNEGRLSSRPIPREDRGAFDSRREHMAEYGAPSGPRDSRPSRGTYLDDAHSSAMPPPRDNGGRYSLDQGFPGPTDRRVRQPQDPNYGRLSNGNSAENSMPPSPTGPRSQRQASFNAPMGGQDGRRQNNGPPSAAFNNRGMAPPPAGVRGSDRFSGTQSQPTSAPGTPTPASHSNQGQAQSQAASQDTTGVHPSRLGHLPVASSNSSGVGGGAGTPSGPRRNNNPGPPTGPSGGDRRRLQGLQDTLQQSQPSGSGQGNTDQGTSIRGIAGGAPSANGDYERHRSSRSVRDGGRHDLVLDANVPGPRHHDARDQRGRGGGESQGYEDGRERRSGRSADRHSGGSGGGGGSGRKRDWNGEGPQSGEKRPRRSGGGF